MDIKDLIALIKQEQQSLAVSMVDGNCSNFEMYQRLVGENIGLHKALSFINYLLEKEHDVE